MREVIKKFVISHNGKILAEPTITVVIEEDEEIDITKDITFPFYLDRYKKAGYNRAGNQLADDLHYGNGVDMNTGHSLYSIEEIKRDLHFLFEYITLHDEPKYLWIDLKLMVKYIFSVGELETVALRMIEHFKQSTGTEFTDPILDQYVIEHPSCERFCNSMEELIKHRLECSHNSQLSEISFEKYNDGSTTPRMIDAEWGHPRFSTLKDTFYGGLTICMNDTWAYEVLVTGAERVSESKWSIEYEVKLFDHFGLDKPDVEKVYKYAAGFRAWFILQHIHNYKPFITKVVFKKSFVYEV